MRKLLLSILFLLAVTVAWAQQVVTIQPQFPERGQQVTITYHPDAPGAKIPADAPAVKLVFSHSNLYELPYVINMEKQGKNWVTTFTLARYAMFASFTFQSGDIIDQPAAKQHYELVIYKNKVPVKNTYLYRGYSLGAQLGKSDSLLIKQQEMFAKELALYPDNYEARVRWLSSKISLAKGKDKDKFRAQAQEVIARKFRENPTEMGNLNLVTMGYLIIGENSRLDSIRKVVVATYPHSGLAKELLTDQLAKVNDEEKKVALLEKELQQENEENSKAYTGMHQLLFEHYVVAKNKDKALYHARKMAAEKTPYTPGTWEDIATQLADNNLALDSALEYANRALQVADSFPVGVVRFFPEYGYIPGYVTDSARQAALRKTKGNLLSLIATICQKQGKQQEAVRTMQEALSISEDKTTLQRAGQFYTTIGAPEKAYQVYWKILLEEPADTAALQALKQNYIAWKGAAAGFEEQQAAIQQVWKEKMTPVLNKSRINKKAPSLAAIVDMDGKPLPAGMLDNKIIVIDFWATWCVPCMEEMPYLQRVYDQYKNNPDVVFMVINSGARNTLENAQQWSGRKKYTFPVYYNTDKEVGEKFGFNIIPATYVIDARNNLQFKSIGFEGPNIEARLGLQIELLLKEK